MKTSWNDISLIENFVNGNLDPNEELLFRARLQVDPVLRLNVMAQKKIYRLIRIFSRKKLYKELDAVHTTMFNSADHVLFQQKIADLFTKN